jgi:hypothetical protein
MQGNRYFGFEEFFLLFRDWHNLFVSKLITFVKY